MKQIVVVSGKGGTGKTVLTASLAALVKNKVLVDCDVDAADLHLMIHPAIKERHEFKGGKIAVINKDICTECGLCLDVCRFDAIDKDFEVDRLSCEGCGVCSHICPYEAVRMEQKIAGEWYISDTEYGPFVHARLGIAEENSGKLVSKIRHTAKALAKEQHKDYVIIDGPPGISCALISSVSGVDLALIVTEPTLSGIHDMLRVMDVANHFRITTKVVINKYDLNPENSNNIEEKCKEKGVEVLGHIPFSDCMIKAVAEGVPPVRYCHDGIARNITGIWEKIAKD
ncbi:MAG: ATP-binding protein [Deltaproteobacteria bacterium]|nr:ATP-binding protein [Deltaproteobacteria bacterium]